MTKIDFYILQDATEEARWHFACRLVDKALKNDHSILVLVDNNNQAQVLDELLWSFKPEAFIPHQLFDAEKPGSAPVEIASKSLPDFKPGPNSLLINLSSAVPPGFERFARVSEVVIQSPEVLKNTREHYSFYRKGGYAIDNRRV